MGAETKSKPLVHVTKKGKHRNVPNFFKHMRRKMLHPLHPRKCKNKNKDNEEKTINREKTIEDKPDEIFDCDEKFTTILGLQTHVSPKHNQKDQEEIQNKEKSIKEAFESNQLQN